MFVFVCCFRILKLHFWSYSYYYQQLFSRNKSEYNKNLTNLFVWIFPFLFRVNNIPRTKNARTMMTMITVTVTNTSSTISEIDWSLKGYLLFIMVHPIYIAIFYSTNNYIQSKQLSSRCPRNAIVLSAHWRTLHVISTVNTPLSKVINSNLRGHTLYHVNLNLNLNTVPRNE